MLPTSHAASQWQEHEEAIALLSEVASEFSQLATHAVPTVGPNILKLKPHELPLERDHKYSQMIWMKFKVESSSIVDLWTHVAYWHYTRDIDIDCVMTLPPKLEGICQRHAASAFALARKCKVCCHILEVQVVLVPSYLCGPSLTIAQNYSYCYTWYPYIVHRIHWISRSS